MERSLGLKLGAIVVLVTLLLVGLMWIGSIVTERQARRDGVVRDIGQSSSLAQNLAGPILVVPYEKTVQEWVHDPATGSRRTIERQINAQLLLAPEDFRLEGDIPTERRTRGIYEARLYHAHLRIQATFDIPPHFGTQANLGPYRFGQPSIALAVSDIRGIGSSSKVLVNDAPAKPLPGTTSLMLGAGLHVPLEHSFDDNGPTHLQFTMELGLQGSSEFHVVPVGRESRIALTSNWANPSFTGEYLPASHSIDATGFKAQWSASFFSTNLEESLRSCADSNSACDEFKSRLLGVSFIDPVDQYLKTDRAIKYALLFISLTFAGFFLFEVLKKLSVHPIQYGLVGAALALFYLLLLSLSEHIGFGRAYLLSAGACVGLIGFYVGSILRSGWRGLGFAGMLTLLYGTLYGLLGSDDYALLMGSVLLFGSLAAVMVLTRKVDWFSLGRREGDAKAN